MGLLRSGRTPLAFLLVTALVFLSASQITNAIDFPEQFDSLVNWKTYRGEVTLDRQLGRQSPSLRVPAAGSGTPDPPGFGDDVNSVYLRNPDTSKLANFTLRFWIYFDDDAGRAMVTFRMQDSRNYYAVWLSDTSDWPLRIYKYLNDEPVKLAETVQKGVFFDPRSWSHVEIRVQGTTISLYIGESVDPVLAASDSQWSAGRDLGIGIYNSHTIGAFHIDDLELLTCEALCYLSISTTTSISTETSTTTSTTTTSTTTTTTSTTISTTTTTTTSTTISTTTSTMTTNTTTTSTITQPKLPVPSAALYVLAAIEFFTILIGAVRLKPREIVAGLVTYALSVLGSTLYAVLTQAWITFTEGQSIMLAVGIPCLAGLLIGWYLRHELPEESTQD